MEFGAKFDLSLDSEGYGRIEKISFEAYNESSSLTEAVERFRKRTGYYPKRVLADQIYRTRVNLNYCKDHGIRLSGPKLGRPGANAKVDKKQEYQDNTDRIEVERSFSLGKRCYGMGCITTKLEQTQLTSIALSVFEISRPTFFPDHQSFHNNNGSASKDRNTISFKTVIKTRKPRKPHARNLLAVSIPSIPCSPISRKRISIFSPVFLFFLTWIFHHHRQQY